jgi:hypothetical protein
MKCLIHIKKVFLIGSLVAFSLQTMDSAAAPTTSFNATVLHAITAAAKATAVGTTTLAGTVVDAYVAARVTLLAHEYGHALTSRFLLGQRTRVLWSWKSWAACSIDVKNEKDEKITLEELMKECEESASKNTDLTKEEAFAQAKEKGRSYIDELNAKTHSKNCDIKDALISAAGPIGGIIGAIGLHKAVSFALQGRMKRPLALVLGTMIFLNLCELFPEVYTDGETSDGAKIVLDLEKRCGYNARKYVFCD